MSVTAEDLIKTLASKAVAAVTNAAPPGTDSKASAKTGQVLVDGETVAKIWAEHMDWAHMDSPEALKAASDATITQIGATNFHNWRVTGGPERMIENAKEARKVGGPDDPTKYDEQGNPIDVPPVVIPDLAGQYLQEANAMGKRAAALERKLQELDTGHGAKGAAAKLAVGVAGLEASVIGAVDTAKTAIEVPADHVSSALVGGKPEKAKQTGEKAKGVKRELQTTIKVALGEAQTLFDKTRPAYKRYVTASSVFYDSRTAWLGCDGELSERSNKALHAMNESFDNLKRAEAEYESEANIPQLEELLKSINEWNQATSTGAGGTAMQIGVEVMGGELMAGEEAAAEKAEQGATKTMTEEEVKEAERKAIDLAKHPLRDKAAEQIRDIPKETMKDLPKDKAEEGIKNVAKANAGGEKDGKKKE